eukprot:scaffold254852_cov20-Prasinocladus_malaysianus.AAC.1
MRCRLSLHNRRDVCFVGHRMHLRPPQTSQYYSSMNSVLMDSYFWSSCPTLMMRGSAPLITPEFARMPGMHIWLLLLLQLLVCQRGRGPDEVRKQWSQQAFPSPPARDIHYHDHYYHWTRNFVAPIKPTAAANDGEPLGPSNLSERVSHMYHRQWIP